MKYLLGALVCFLLSLIPFPLSAEQWYASGPGGVLRNPIAQGQTKGWTVFVEQQDDNTELQTLYFNNQIQSRLKLIRADGHLITREERDAQGELLSRIEYLYDKDGNPRASYLRSTDEESTEEEFTRVEINSQSSVQIDGNYTRSISGYGDNWIISDMNASGQLTKQFSYRDSAPLIEEIWTRAEDGQLLEYVKKEDKTVLNRYYDEQGRIAKEETWQDRYLIHSRWYSWQDSNLVRVEELGEGERRVREIQWSGNRISIERLFINGIIAKEIEWTSPAERTETAFQDGQPYIRTYWADNNKVREELTQKDNLLKAKRLSR